MKRALLLAALATAATAWAQDALTPEALMRQLAGTGAATVAFTETRHSSALKTPLVTSGELRYTRPAQLERRVRSPSTR